MNAFWSAAFVVFFYPWLIMLTLGGLHHEVSSSIPAPSFFGSMILTGALILFAAPIGAASKGGN